MKKIKMLMGAFLCMNLLALSGCDRRDNERPCRGIRCTDSIFLYALHDPDYIVVTDYGAIYARHKG